MDNTTLLHRVQSAYPAAILASSEFRGELSLVLRPEALLDVAAFLRDEPELNYTFLENLCAVDYLGREPRFEVVYHLLSVNNSHRVCLKVGAAEEHPLVPSLTPLWPTANWQEREAFDLMGIQFSGHPALERILMPEDWIGHPQRKDVPLGYEEVAFTFNQEKIYAQKPFAKE
ncbi:MAG: NADH-quinone oxidoreductase subunit C [Chloroflexaceae bacterium]|jgi:NADH-quinone oxidoreductase subunit C|nr:NADH-quinone oxidoreductase subunit C [Chloroflexaceae bacterium]